MAGAAISPPATRAVDPSRSFFIILPLSLIRNWYVPKGLSDRRKVGSQNAATHCPRQYGLLIEHAVETRVKKWTPRRTILPSPVAPLSHFAALAGACAIRLFIRLK